jgi:hypothetical protein
MTEEVDGPRSIPELPKQASTLPDITEMELLDMFRSAAEFRFLESPIYEM